MKTFPRFLKGFGQSAVVLFLALATNGQAQLPPRPAAQSSSPIPVDQVGTLASPKYRGGGLSGVTIPDGVRLNCVFQRLEGRVAPEGLWLTSTAPNSQGEQFRVIARSVGRAM